MLNKYELSVVWKYQVWLGVDRSDSLMRCHCQKSCSRESWAIYSLDTPVSFSKCQRESRGNLFATTLCHGPLAKLFLEADLFDGELRKGFLREDDQEVNALWFAIEQRSFRPIHVLPL